MVYWRPKAGWGSEKGLRVPSRRWRVFEDDDECRAEQAESRRGKKELSYPGSTGTLGATWIWLILLLAGLRRISECLPMTISQVKTHVASLTTWRRKSASRLCCGHL